MSRGQVPKWAMWFKERLANDAGADDGAEGAASDPDAGAHDEAEVEDDDEASAILKRPSAALKRPAAAAEPNPSPLKRK
eukprot:5832844-Pyramimonas_sp.AAC.1